MPPPNKAAPSGFDKKPQSQLGVDKKLRDRVEGKVLTSEEATELLKRLEAQTAMLRNKYDQFFLGLERAAPTKEREMMKKQIDELKLQVGRNTALKFGVQSLFHRFQTYERMWARTEKEIEEGRYSRHIFKARLHSKEREAGRAEERAIEKALEKADETDDVTFEDVQEVDEAPAPAPAVRAAPSPKSTIVPGSMPARAGTTPPPAARTGTPIPRAATPAPMARAAAPAQAPRAAAPSPAGAPSDDKLRAVYQAYVSAKKQCKESTKGMTFEQVASQLRQQVPQILSQTKAKGVDFKVVIKDGKASLRAVPKE